MMNPSINNDDNIVVNSQDFEEQDDFLNEPLLGQNEEEQKGEDDVFPDPILPEEQEQVQQEVFITLANNLALGNLDFFTKVDSKQVDDFFQNLLYKVNLDELYKIIDTCYYSQAMPFCPILIENMQYDPRQEGESKYHLLIWSEKGDLVWEAHLSEKPVSWCITFEYLIYKPHSIDQINNIEAFVVVDINKKINNIINSQYAVDITGLRDIQTIENPIIGYCNKCLYISDSKTVYILNLNNLTNNAVIREFSQNQRAICTIDLGPLVKNHAFYIKQELDSNGLPLSPQRDRFDSLTMCCETQDNQFDFVMLVFYPEKFIQNQRKPWNIKQISPVVARPTTNDPVTKFRTVFDNSPNPMPYSIALRRSKCVDIYWNYNLIDTIDIGMTPDKTKDIEINFFAYYIQDIKNNIRIIELNEKGNVSHKESRQLKAADELMTLQQYSHLKSCQHNNFFQAQSIIVTSYIVAHQETLYVYDLIEGIWASNSINLENKVKFMFPYRDSNRDHNLMILKDDGTTVVMSNKDLKYYNPKMWYLNLELPQQQLPGPPIQIVCDQQRSRVVYILSQVNSGQQKLCLMFQGQLYNMDDPLISQNDNIIMQLQSPSTDSQMVCYTKGLNGAPGELKIISTSFIKIDKVVIPETKLVWRKIINDQEIADSPHTAFALNEKDLIFLADKKNIYKVYAQTDITETLPNINIISMQVIDDQNCYAYISMPGTFTKQRQSGMKLFNLLLLIETNQIIFQDIENTFGSINYQVQFTADSHRLVYMKNNDIIHIIPPVHRTTVNFMGMRSRTNYIATKKSKDKFYALDRNNIITTWDAVNGKLLDQKQIHKEFDFSNYVLFGLNQAILDMTYVREWSQSRSLIVCKEETKENINMNVLSQVGPIENIFKYGQRLTNQIQGCSSYTEQDEQNMLFKLFKVIEIINESTVAVHMSFVHHHYSSQNQIHKIIISNDCEIMIEKLINLRVNIYKRIRNIGADQWDFQRRFTDFPHDLCGLSQNLYLFSPNLQKFLDIDSQTFEFVIKDCLFPDDDCPKLQIKSLIFDDEKEDLRIVVKRFKWIDNESFLFASRDGLEKRYKIDYASKKIQELSSSQIPAFFQLQDAPQIYVDTAPLSLGSIQRRLFRKHQALKQQRFIFGFKEWSKIIDSLISIDYNVLNNFGMMVIELPFSWILWKIIEKIASGQFKLYDQLDNTSLKLLSLNIMPGCKTIIHKFNENIELSQFLSKIAVNAENFEMPFIADLKGKTRLHYCIEKQDVKTAGLLMNYLADAPLDHHSREIADLIPDLIRLKVPYLTNYLEKRIIQTRYLNQIQRGAVKTKKETFEPGLMVASIWDNQKNIKDGLFLPMNVPRAQMPIETEVELFFIDLPELIEINSDVFKNFFKSLKETDNIYASQIFQSSAIKYIIDYHWRITRFYTQRMLFFPFLLYLLAFFIFTNFIDELSEMIKFSGIQFYPWVINVGFLVVLSLYFIRNEYNQIQSMGINYFMEPWNYIDLVPPVMVLLITMINALSINTPFESILKSMGSFFMWLKLLYFLRIYRTTGYLVRMIVQVIQEMKVFLLVLLITILAVADAQISIQEYDKDLDGIKTFWEFIGHNLSRFVASVNITYQMILGGDGFTAQEQYQLAGSILIVFTKLFVMIVMLNLVISIIGDTFGRVKQNSLNEYYKEISCVISENSYLIPDEVKLKRATKPGQLLIVCTKIRENLFNQ